MSRRPPDLWWVTWQRIPRGVTAEQLGQAPHVRQCQIMGRARSRAEFARKLVAAGLDWRSAGAVAREVGDYGGTTGNADDLVTIPETDPALYVRSLHDRTPPIPLPDQTERPTP